MIYKGPGFLDLAPPPPPALSPLSKLNQWHTRRLVKRGYLLTGEGE